MKRSLLALILVATAASAAAQAQNSTTTVMSHHQAAAAGAAGVTARVHSLGYTGIRELRRGPDGQWTGKATQNGVEKNITMAPDGTTIAR